jgi:hypothetical protein
MPTVSIDTFFACTLLVSIALIATASLTGTMQTNIRSQQDLNKESYLSEIAENIVTSYGSPVNWGSSITVPNSFGLSDLSASQIYTLDADKISRLTNQSSHPLSYIDAFNAARLNNIAMGITVAQVLSISIQPSSNETVGDETEYNFIISVSQDSGPIYANLHCYVAVNDFCTSVSNTTSNEGVGYISFQIPNSYSGNALLIVLARAALDDRLTAYNVYSFPHLSQDIFPNNTFLRLTSFNNTLSLNQNSPEIRIEKCYAFSYSYQSNLQLISSENYAIPQFLDKSPIVLVVSGSNETNNFIDYTSYPSLPFKFGADFTNSEENVFVYSVAIKGALYKLTLSFGDVIS